MKLTTGILTLALVAGGVWTAQAAAQNPDAIDNARSIAKSLQQKQANDTNAALDAAGVGQPSKPAAGAPAPAIKPAVIPGSNPAPSPAAHPAAKAAAAAQVELKSVDVVPGSDAIRIELSSSGAVAPRVSKLSSPARILVELPGTAAATAHNHIAVGNGGVKGVRIGMDGKTPPTTSVVVDLEQALAFDVTPGPADKLVLTVHTQGTTAAAKPAAPAKAAAPAPAVAKSVAPAPAVAKSVAPAKLVTVAKTTVPAKAAPAPVPVKAAAPTAKTIVAKTIVAKSAPAPKAAPAKAAAAKPAAPAAAPAEATAEAAKPQPKPEEKKWAMSGRRDPFFSPVVQQPTGSGCSTGKKCLEIGNINLRGVVKSDSGFIAVVTNNLNKAYFLRENDPVFNGYVVKITGDSVTFQETVEDKLGKPFTREVVKRIFTPAV
jgi:Tfp pilus assembly protein PilP